jgi:wyosine [tRNA(Phe)-imidazoG37] synthetase (radical SAM superfamily)
VFFRPEEILRDVREKVEKARGVGEFIDYLTFVPDGEPTLDVNLGREIGMLRPLGIKIAVITNGSLVWRTDVRNELMKADWVSLKVDSVREEVWRRINNPHRTLKLASILDGMLEFARTYKGELVTETMLVKGVNDGEELMEETAGFLARLKPSRVYISIPTRPPSEKWVHPPEEGFINKAYHIFSQRIESVEYLIGYEGNAFAFTGNVEDDLLSITAVHPMREEAVRELLTRGNAGWSVVEKLIREGKIVRVEYEGNRFYIRRIGYAEI